MTQNSDNTDCESLKLGIETNQNYDIILLKAGFKRKKIFFPSHKRIVFY